MRKRPLCILWSLSLCFVEGWHSNCQGLLNLNQKIQYFSVFKYVVVFKTWSSHQSVSQRLFWASKIQNLQYLIKTNALVLQLQENVSGSVFRTTYPFITFKRISGSDKLPKNLKCDGDPLSDYFITLKSLKNNGEKSGLKSGFVILAYKVTDDDRTIFYDQTWEIWSGAADLSSKLATKYEIRKIVCFKGTVFENHRKSLIHFCERSELRLHFEWTKVN